MDIAKPGSRKTELRLQANKLISDLPDDYIKASDTGLLDHVLSHEEFQNARNIMIYYSVKREPCTLGIAETAYLEDKTVAFPYCFRGGIMQARIVSSLDQLRPAVLGIPAPPDTAPVLNPEELDLIIVPALLYDTAGYRLGYGGGYFDRFLCGIPAFTIGLARTRLMVEMLPREKHDIAVKCIVTEDIVLHTAKA